MINSEEILTYGGWIIGIIGIIGAIITGNYVLSLSGIVIMWLMIIASKLEGIKSKLK